MIADREPYCQELRGGRLERAASKGTKLLLSDSLFDPTVLMRGPYSNLDRRAQPVPQFQVFIYKIGPRKKKWTYDTVARGVHKLPINTSTFESPVVSCLNIAGSMLQAAAILGAKKIYTIGIEMKWPKKGSSHFYGDGASVGAYPQDGSINNILGAMKEIKRIFKKDDIQVINLSPDKTSPFASVFGANSPDGMMKKYANVQPFNRDALKNVAPSCINFEDLVVPPATAICMEADAIVENQ